MDPGARERDPQPVGLAGERAPDPHAARVGHGRVEDTILQLKSQNPDVVFAAGEPASITLLFQQLNELDYWPTYGWVGVGGGYSNSVTHQNLGPLAEGLICVNDISGNR